MSCNIILNEFAVTSSVHSQNTRFYINLVVPRLRTDKRSRYFSVSEIKLFYHKPCKIRDLENPKLSSAVLNWLLENTWFRIEEYLNI